MRRIRHSSWLQRRGAMYFAVLATSTLVVLIGLSALTMVRVQRRQAVGSADLIQARLLARSAIELGLQRIADNPTWRDDEPDGYWFSDRRAEAGMCSLHVEDPDDGVIAGEMCGRIVLTGYGMQGTARQMLRAEFEADADGFDPLREALHAFKPVGYWRLGEAGGTTAADETGNQAGTYYYGVGLGQTVPFRCDTAARFDGYDDLVAIAHDSAFALNEGSVHFWFNQPTSSAHWEGLFGKDSLDFDDGGHLTISITSGYVMARLQSKSANYYLWSSVVSSGDWHQVVLTFGNSDGLRLYIDGTLADAEWYTGGMSSNQEPIGIGIDTTETDDKSLSGWTNPFRGMIDEVALLPVAVTAEEVKALHDVGAATPPHTVTVVPGSWERAVDP